MKQELRNITWATAASLVTAVALAQDTIKPKVQQDDTHREIRADDPRTSHWVGAAKSTDIIGMPVKNYQDEKLGKVDELAVDLESGRIVQVILSVGGFIGVGDALTAVPPGALHHDVANKVVHLDADKEKVKNAPKFEMSKWNDCCGSDDLSQVYRHYGQETAFTFIDKGTSTGEPKGAGGDVPSTPSSTQPNGSRVKDRAAGDNLSMIPVSRLSHVQKASELIGTSVKNLKEEKLGKVENLVVDLASGRIVTVIVSSGGFLGIGDELSALPPTVLRFTGDRQTLHLDATKGTLSSAPHFNTSQWPDFTQPNYADEVYRAYRVEPYFTTNLTTEADNSGVNVRDRSNRTLTPLDQGNSKADVDTTVRIRKEVVSRKELSVNAKNVKIITNNGQVTLRGPVSTPEEKRIIGEIAVSIAQLKNVDNQLDVK